MCVIRSMLLYVCMLDIVNSVVKLYILNYRGHAGPGGRKRLAGFALSRQKRLCDMFDVVGGIYCQLNFKHVPSIFYAVSPISLVYAPG